MADNIDNQEQDMSQQESQPTAAPLDNEVELGTVDKFEPFEKTKADEITTPTVAPSQPQPSSNAAKLPSWDEAMAERKSQLPTFYQAIQKERPDALTAASNLAKAAIGGDHQELSEAQRIWAQNSYIAPVLKAFGAGWANDIKQNNYMQLDQDTYDTINNLGAWKDYKKNEDAVHSGFMDSVLLPALQKTYEHIRQEGFAPAARAISGVGKIAYVGGMEAPFAGAESAIEEAQARTGVPLAAGFEYLTQTAEGLGGLNTGIPKVLPPTIARGSAAGVLEDEEVFNGSKNPTDVQQKTMSEASHQQSIVEKAPEPQKTIHDVVRENNPELFNKYDDLSAKRDTLGEQLRTATKQRYEDAIAASPYADDIVATQEKLENADNQRKEKIYQNRLTDLLNKHDDWVSEKIKEDTPELAEARGRYQEADYAMRDMAVDVSAAYRDAEIKMPKQETPAKAEEAAPSKEPLTVQKYVDDYMAGNGRDSLEHQQFAANNAQAIEDEFKSRMEQSKEGKSSSVEEQHQYIAKDVSKRLVDAGRPQAEADAVGELIAAHYRAIAEQGWAKGTPKELYDKHAAEIKSDPRAMKSGTLGKTFFGINGAKNIITLFGGADSSTFIHELGHHWLDEMARFGTEDDAPKDLKDHLKTVQDWLKIKDIEDIPTRAHEKFARGFERYMREGIAPSKGLDNVFSQFRQWLRQIYQTVDRLRAPITDDIRNVYDRLLSANPEKTVVAPEEENELPQEPQSPSEPPVGNQELPQQEKEPNKVAQGGIGTPEEEKSPLAAEPSKEEKVEKQANPTYSSERVPDDHYVDKAGNLRLDNLNEEEDGKAIARELAARNQDFMVERGGVVSDLDRRKMADATGIDYKNIDPKKIPAGVSPSVWAEVVQKACWQALDAAKKAARDYLSDSSEENDIKATQSQQRFLMLARALANTTAEAGRTLRVFDKSNMSFISDVRASLTDATGKTLFQRRMQARLLDSLDTAQKQAKMLQKTEQRSAGMMLLEHWLNALISGIATHITYTEANLLTNLWETVETGVAAGLGTLSKGEKSNITLGEVPARLKAIIPALPEAIMASKEAFKRGVTSLLPNEEPWKTPYQSTAQKDIEAYRIKNIETTGKNIETLKNIPKDILSSVVDSAHATYTFVKGSQWSLQALGEFAKNLKNAEWEYSPLGVIPDLKVGDKIIPIGTIDRVPGRAVGAFHSFSRTIGYNMAKAAEAYRTTATEAKTNPEKFSTPADFANRVTDLEINPSEDQMRSYIDMANRSVLMTHGGEFTRRLSSLVNIGVNIPGLGYTKPLRFIDPFIHISSNLISRGVIDRSVLAGFHPELRKDLFGNRELPQEIKDMELGIARDNAEKNFNYRAAVNRDFARARVVAGTMFAGAIMSGVAMGRITGSAPKDPKERGAWYAAGYQPHSILIGDHWIALNKFGPMGLLAGFSADMYHAGAALSHGEMAKAAGAFVSAFSNNVLEESSMRGPAELIGAIQDGGYKADKYIQNMASSFLPFSSGLSQSARAQDPYMRQVHSVWDAIKAKIPGQRESLKPVLDVWGEPIQNKETLGPAGFSSIYMSRVNTDPVNKAFRDLGIWPAQPDHKIRKVKLTDDQYFEYCQFSGRMAKQRLDNIVNQEWFNQIPPENQAKLLTKTVSDSRKQVQKYILAKYHDQLIDQAIQQRNKILASEK